MNIQIEGTHYSLISYCLGKCHITEIGVPESGETIARGISEFSSVQSEKEAIEKANQRLSRRSFLDFDLMVGG